MVGISGNINSYAKVSLDHTQRKPAYLLSVGIPLLHASLYDPCNFVDHAVLWNILMSGFMMDPIPSLTKIIHLVDIS